ncbi:MAG: OmpA family protein [Pseudohongiellaceae bacterium]
MNIQSLQGKSFDFKKLTTVAAAMLVLAACASAPTAPVGSAAVRSKLTMLRTNAALADRAPIEILAAELAVSAAERPQESSTLGRHLVLIADQKVDIASSWAQSRLYEDQRGDLSARSEAVRLDARTREADRARNDAANAQAQAQAALNDASRARNTAANARNEADAARRATDVARDQTALARNDATAARNATDIARDQTAVARNDANAARSDANDARLDASDARSDADTARAETEELQRQINALNARTTDRGLVVTLGDVLFATGMSELRGGTPENLDNLANFLNRYSSRTVLIEGHTDSVGTDSSNLGLSQRRADSVQAYLVGRGVNRSRIGTSGMGESLPIADNETPTGRQQNRRVEVIISNQ